MAINDNHLSLIVIGMQDLNSGIPKMKYDVKNKMSIPDLHSNTFCCLFRT